MDLSDIAYIIGGNVHTETHCKDETCQMVTVSLRDCQTDICIVVRKNGEDRFETSISADCETAAKISLVEHIAGNVVEYTSMYRQDATFPDKIRIPKTLRVACACSEEGSAQEKVAS